MSHWPHMSGIATIARAQDNRCFALASFLVGRNYMAAEEGSAPDVHGQDRAFTLRWR